MQSKEVFKASAYQSKGSIKSPLRYPGGKFYALKHIMPYINCVPHDEYREPFFGGGSVFFAKDKVQFNVLNDLETKIVNFYKAIQDDKLKEELIKKLNKEVANKERHNEMKNFKPRNLLEEVYQTYYLNRTSYSGIINKPAWGYADGKSSPPQNWGAFIQKAAQKLAQCDFFNQDFAEILDMKPRGKNVLCYLDPPYFHADQKRAYTKPFEIKDHERLANHLKNFPHKFCLSYDDCSEIRHLYRWANIYDVSWLYNTSNLQGTHRKACKELIITNYSVTHD